MITISSQDLLAIAPILVVALGALIVLTIEALKDRTEAITCWISMIVLVLAVVLAWSTMFSPGIAFAGMVTTGGYASFLAAVFCLAGLLSVMLSKSYLQKEEMDHGEFYALVLIAVVGMMLMASAADLIIFETMSIAFYLLAGFARSRPTSNEAALKYFLLGAFATGFLLYGIALLYGTAGTTSIPTIVVKSSVLVTNPTFLIGLGLLFIGLAFKIAAVPFHMWVPDVYEGSPTTVSGLMSTGGKAAAFSVLLVIFAPPLLKAVGPLREVLALVAALSMIVGNVLAISQTNIKRLLAYSSIAHAGYMLTGVVAANAFGSAGVLFYLVAYTVMNLGAFGVLSLLESSDGKNVTLEDYAGLSSKNPVIAGFMALFMFSLTGIPPFAGFFGKYYVFAGAVEAGYTWLAIIGVLMSVVSAYYYLRIVVLMYFKEQTSVLDLPVPTLGLVSLALSAVALLVFGIFPSSVLNLMVHLF
jgi:NADH-quinone oxidoreductase subunit N